MSDFSIIESTKRENQRYSAFNVVEFSPSVAYTLTILLFAKWENGNNILRSSLFVSFVFLLFLRKMQRKRAHETIR